MSLIARLKNLFKSKPKEERRRSPRIYASDVFFVEYKSEKSQKFEYASGRDISVHGVRFATSGKLKKGDTLDIRIIFPSKFEVAKKVELKCKVVRIYKPKGVRRDRVGVEFIHESDASQILLKRFCHWLSGQQPTVKRKSYGSY